MANTQSEYFSGSNQVDVVVEEGACDNKMRRELDLYMQPLTPQLTAIGVTMTLIGHLVSSIFKITR